MLTFIFCYYRMTQRLVTVEMPPWTLTDKTISPKTTLLRIVKYLKCSISNEFLMYHILYNVRNYIIETMNLNIQLKLCTILLIFILY